MTNPLERSILRAETANQYIGRLFTYLGSGNPNGVVTKAYRNAYRGLDHALREDDPGKGAKEVMEHLKEALGAMLLKLLKQAGDYGKSEAIAQLKDYQLTPPAKDSVGLSTEADAALAAILAVVTQQDLTIQALVLTGATREVILGTERRAGALLSSSVIAVAARWVASMVWEGFEGIVTPYQAQLQKMAVAVIDDKTTECCLEVHGQVEYLGAPFHLTGDPHFAEEMEKPPFHWHCRTSVALYDIGYDSGISQRMREAANSFK